MSAPVTNIQPPAETKQAQSPAEVPFPPAATPIPPAYNPQGQQQPYYPAQPQMLAKTVWTKESQPAICQYCKQRTQTNIYKESGTGAWIVAGILCCLTPCCCLAWMPFGDHGCQDVKHQCQHCNMIIGEKRFLDI